MKPEANVKKKVQALDRRKGQIDWLIAFLQSHPLVASECILRPLWHRLGLYFSDYALIRPLFGKNGGHILRLEKYGEKWQELHPEDDPMDGSLRTVCEDVSKMPEKKLLRMLTRIHMELAPEDFED